jgi:hypothetical protein
MQLKFVGDWMEDAREFRWRRPFRLARRLADLFEDFRRDHFKPADEDADDVV